MGGCSCLPHVPCLTVSEVSVCLSLYLCSFNGVIMFVFNSCLSHTRWSLTWLWACCLLELCGVAEPHPAGHAEAYIPVLHPGEQPGDPGPHSEGTCYSRILMRQAVKTVNSIQQSFLKAPLLLFLFLIILLLLSLLLSFSFFFFFLFFLYSFSLLSLMLSDHSFSVSLSFPPFSSCALFFFFFLFQQTFTHTHTHTHTPSECKWASEMASEDLIIVSVITS